MAFDKSKAERIVWFFENVLTLPGGKPFELLPVFRVALEDIFGTIKPDGRRHIREAHLEVGKKNAKTTIAAGVALYGLTMDDEPDPEIYSAATSRDQAGIAFRAAAAMVKRSKTLSRICTVINSTKTITLKDATGFYRAISADAGVQDGINPHMAIVDELHRFKDRDLYDILSFGTATRSQPLVFQITTAGIPGESPLYDEKHEYARNCINGTFHDPTFYPLVLSLDKDEDPWFEGESGKWDEKKRTWSKPPSGWYKANPALGSYMSLDAVRKEAESAKRTPASENSFRRFRLNQRVEQESRFIPLHEWDECGVDVGMASLRGRQCFAGLDLSSRVDITALHLIFPEEDGSALCVPWFWLPEEAARGREGQDRVPYRAWAAEGHLTLTQGNVVDYGIVRRTVNDLRELYDIQRVAGDPWQCGHIGQELLADGVDFVEIPQGFARMSAPTKEFEARIISRKLRHDKNPLMRWMVDCCSVKQDPAGNIRPVKPDRRKSSKRIDGVVAAIMALDLVMRQQQEQESVYRTRGVLYA